jgi:hypothetical protein
MWGEMNIFFHLFPFFHHFLLSLTAKENLNLLNITTMFNVNAHLHTPYSFSAFSSIDQALDMAWRASLKAACINDFYTAAGYREWQYGCDMRRIYPMFGIEFISLNEDDQKNGLRVNDPANPGRTYISGKGMACPMELDEYHKALLDSVVKASNKQVEQMCKKVNEILKTGNAGFLLNVRGIKRNLTSGIFRERHLAKAIRMEAYKYFSESEEALRVFFRDFFGGKDLKSNITDLAGVENEIRANMLKAGGRAFVAETPEAFLPTKTVCEIILAGKGIPTYPFLADDVNGAYTDFENNLERVAAQLTERGFHSVEFISTRNDANLLEKYASYLYDQGFIVTLGSEHNTPAMEPIKLFARNGVPLSDKLMDINFNGASVIAAHQYFSLFRCGGYLDKNGNADRNQREFYERVGRDLILNR